MKALRWCGGRLGVADVAAPERGPEEALVRVSLAGICRTDLEIVRGYMGFEGTLGHEFVGVVEDHDDPSWVGRRVCGDINLACGGCARCGSGEEHHCPRRTVLGIVGKDGAFAEHLTLPARNLVPVPDHVSDEAAVFAEPLAAAFEILEQVPITAQTRALVLGDGRLGLLCALTLATTGCDLTLSGRHQRKLAIAAAAGVRTTIGAPAADFDVVVEATGSPAGLAEAIDRVRPRGALVLKSTFAGRPEVDTNRLVIDEIRVVGSRCGPMPRAVSALASGAVDPTPLIDARLPLTQGVAAMARAGAPGVLKVLLAPRSCALSPAVSPG